MISNEFAVIVCEVEFTERLKIGLLCGDAGWRSQVRGWLVVRGLSVLLISHFTLKVTQIEHSLGSRQRQRQRQRQGKEWLLLR